MRPSRSISEPNFKPVPTDESTQGGMKGRRASVTQPGNPAAQDLADSISQAREPEVSPERYSYSPLDPQRNRSSSDNFNESKHERMDPADFHWEQDEQELPSPQSAGASMTHRQAQEAVREHAALLVATLTQGKVENDGRNDGSMYLLMGAASKAFKQLLAHGVPFGEALAVFTKSAGDTFQQLDSEALGEVRDGLERLDFFAQDTNRNVLHRAFATAIIEMAPKQLRRAALDEERALHSPPDTPTGEVKQGVLSAWRKTKRTAEAIDLEIGGAHRLARQSAEARAKTRGALDAMMQRTMRIAGAGGPARDITIAANLTLLTTALPSADGEIQHPSLDEFLAFAEDFLLAQDTGALVDFAQALLETAPSRPKNDETLNALGKSLQTVLEMRPGTEETTRELRMTPLSGNQPSGVRDEFRRQRVGEALESLAQPNLTTAPNGSKFVAGVFMGLHRAIPPHGDNVFKENMQLGLRKGATLQLLQIKANLEFVYPRMPIGRVTTVYELVQRELRNRAMRLGDADLDAAPAVGAAAASQDKSPAQLKLEAIASNLALTLPNPPLARPLDDAALITSFLRQAGEQVQQLMNEGNSFHRSVLLFGAAAHARFLAMEPHTLNRLIKGLERLDSLPTPTNGAIVQRRLIDVLQQFDAKGMHRRTLDKELENAPPPMGIAAI
ncbi:MAG: hypothetical protein H7255_20340, partial [Ramlibacter sp.]|nr:hypothetical protein [Ramlibacter sp.]